MADQPNISQILAALTAQRPGGTPLQGQPSGQQQQQQQQPPPTHGYSNPYANTNPPTATPYNIPQPSNSGSLDLSNIKPVHSGSVSLADAIARARGIAAEKGVSFDTGRGGGGGTGTPSRDSDPRLAGRAYRRSRSRSRSPPRVGRDNFRDNYNPYRDERRDDPRRTAGSGFARERSFSPAARGRPTASNYSPPPSRGYERSPQGRRNEDNQETISIDSSLVGLIIGRQGENLRRVEAETATRVQFMTGPEAIGPMRACKITGTRKAREDAKAEIYRIIDENGSSSTTKAANADRTFSASGKGSSNHQPALRTGEDASQIMVPNRTVGLIIGRGGETIRDLQERSGCHVNIVGEEKSVNGLRPVNLIGTAQAAAMAKDLIMEIVESDTKSLANQSGASRDAGRASAAAGFDGGNGFSGEKVSDTIVVPSEAVGMIIGKGGETIKDMQTTTGCKINVAPATGQDFRREIGLVGARGSIEAAKRAIMDKVHAVEEKNRPSGGAHRDDHYNDRFANKPQQQQQQQPPYGQQNTTQSQAAPAGITGGDVDPYAAYGGYQNYVALWYSSLQAQQAQQHTTQDQGPPGEQRPPGS